MITEEVLCRRRRAADDRHRPWAMVSHDPMSASCADPVVVPGYTKSMGQTQDPTAEPVLDRIKSLEA